MNERIQELAYEAEEQAEREVDQGSGFNGETFHPTFCRIFAESIVRECVGILQHREHHAVIVNSIKEIKERFGVEQ